MRTTLTALFLSLATIPVLANNINQPLQTPAQAGETPARASENQPGSASDTANLPERAVVYRKIHGNILAVSEEAHDYPAGDSKGTKHAIKGVLRHIGCSYPTVLVLTVEEPTGKKTTLYTNNYFKIPFNTANYVPIGPIKPCEDIEDMKATVKFADVTDTIAAGQILSVDLFKESTTPPRKK